MRQHVPHVHFAAIEVNRSDEPVLVPADVEDRELAQLIGMNTARNDNAACYPSTSSTAGKTRRWRELWLNGHGVNYDVPFSVLDHGDRRLLGIVGVWKDAYFDPLAKSVQEAKEAVDAIAFHATTHQGGHLGLV
jgi:hypothetical protein